MTNGNDQAFGISHRDFCYLGLTKREYFAAMAMQGRMATFEGLNESFELTAEIAVTMADELIAALNGEE